LTKESAKFDEIPWLVGGVEGKIAKQLFVNMAPYLQLFVGGITIIVLLATVWNLWVNRFKYFYDRY